MNTKTTKTTKTTANKGNKGKANKQKSVKVDPKPTAADAAAALKTLSEMEAEATATHNPAEGVKVDYKFAKHTTTHTANGKTINHEGKAILRVNFGGGWVMVADLARNTRPDLEKFADTFSPLVVKVMRVKLLEVLGGVVTAEAKTAAADAAATIKARAEKRVAADLATLGKGVKAYKTAASNAAGKRFGRLEDKYIAMGKYTKPTK